MTVELGGESSGADSIGEATSRILELEAELEAAGDATTAEDSLQELRQTLHVWVDTVTAVVATPGMGRVVLIHKNGRESRISSPDLPMLLSKPARFSVQGTGEAD
ncbi:hypothetical protein ABVV53_02000 [Novosphingobium sp. RD2P27]|uniref:Uncharacterized protein n=1 Tax=Novosphingobium kalidii TaxID=3230299 RepID=A0ABV2CXB5_9SPHN